MKAALFAATSIVAMAAIVAITLSTATHSRVREEDAEDNRPIERIDSVGGYAYYDVGAGLTVVTDGQSFVAPMLIVPADPFPVVQGGQWTINCSSVDAGTAVADLLAPDGGVTKRVDTVYVAPVVGSSVKVRVGYAADIGGADLTASTGFELGSGARDGVGVSLNARGRLRCKSEGAAQLVDVIAGRNQ